MENKGYLYPLWGEIEGAGLKELTHWWQHLPPPTDEVEKNKRRVIGKRIAWAPEWNEEIK